jgi:hypothetical protein
MPTLSLEGIWVSDLNPFTEARGLTYSEPCGEEGGANSEL